MELKTLYAMRGTDFVSIRLFQREFRDNAAKIRPDDLTCPECENPIIVRYPRDPAVQTRAVHFAHSPQSDPGDRCALTHKETAEHFNAKIMLSRYMGHALKNSRGFGVVYTCSRCHNQETAIEILDYDRAVPERKIASRRPDVCCFAGDAPIGAAEIYHTHAVDEQKEQELNALSIGWFEIPAEGYLHWDRSILPFNSRSGYTITCIDSTRISIFKPSLPNICPLCEERMRKEAAAKAKAAEDRRRREEEERMRREFEESERAAQRAKDREAEEARWEAYREQQRKATEERAAAVAARKAAEEAERERLGAEAERVAAERKAAYAAWKAEFEQTLRDSEGDIHIPLNAPVEYQWWNPVGQSIYKTLIRFNGSLSAWRNYGAQNDDLLTLKHRTWCDKDPIRYDGFAACECGYYKQQKMQESE